MLHSKLFAVFALWIHTNPLLSEPPVIPERMMCSYSSSLINDSVKAVPIELGSCTFNHTMCNYSEACSDDPGNVTWLTVEDYVYCKGVLGRLQVFSAIISPVLNIGYVSCLQIKFTMQLPGKLSVFLANSTTITNVFNMSTQEITDFREENIELQPSVSAVGFRAGEPTKNSTVKLRDVKLQFGSCYHQQCNFDQQTFCRFINENWTLADVTSLSTSLDSWISGNRVYSSTAESAIAGTFACMDVGSTEGSLATALNRAVPPYSDCLTFTYLVGGVNAKLEVYFEQFNAPAECKWTISSNETIPLIMGSLSVQIPATLPYRIIFKGTGCAGMSIIAIDNILTKNKSCDKNNTYSVYQNNTFLSNWTCSENATLNTIWKPHTSSGISESVQTSPTSDLTSTTQETAAIVGPIIAGVVIIIAIVLILVCVRRKRQKSNSNKNTFTENRQRPKECSESYDSGQDLHTDDKQFKMIKTQDSARLDKTVTTDISTKRNNRPYAPIEVDQHHSHAYDLIPESGISRKIPLEECDHYDLAGTTNEFNMHSLSSGNNSSNFNRLKQAERPDYSTVQINRQNHGITDETVDEYNRIELENHTSKKESVNATLNARDMLQSKVPAYSLVQKSSHIPKVTNETVDEYNRIDLENHTSKKESVSATLNAHDMLQSKVPAYSLVQKSSHIPKVTNETVDEYNRIDKERHIYGKEPTSNVYNKLKSPVCDIPSNCINESLKPVMDMPQDDYNKLDYKQNHRNQPADDKGDEIEDECSPTLKAYSSVGNHTDTYARVHSDKKDNIIASDYDHIV